MKVQKAFMFALLMTVVQTIIYFTTKGSFKIGDMSYPDLFVSLTGMVTIVLWCRYLILLIFDTDEQKRRNAQFLTDYYDDQEDKNADD